MRRKGGGDSGGGGERRGEGFKNPDRIPGIPVASSPVPQSTPPIRIHKASAKHPQSRIPAVLHPIHQALFEGLFDGLFEGLFADCWSGWDPTGGLDRIRFELNLKRLHLSILKRDKSVNLIVDHFNRIASIDRIGFDPGQFDLSTNASTPLPYLSAD